MADQLPIIAVTHAVNANVTPSTSLLGRGLAAIQSGKLAESTEFDEEKFLSVLCRVMDAAFRMGHITFKQNARYVLDEIRERGGDAAINSITIDYLQAAYIGMKKGTTSKKEVVSIESIDELYLDEELSLSSHSQELSRGENQKELDPELLTAGMTLAAFHIEAGARSFAAYSKEMIADLGEVYRPYLRLFYESARCYPGFDNSGMDDYESIEKTMMIAANHRKSQQSRQST